MLNYHKYTSFLTNLLVFHQELHSIALPEDCGIQAILRTKNIL